MSGTEDVLFRRVREWVRYADEDLRLARHGLTLTSGCPYRLIAYHAQQCAEKYLKAFLVFSEIDLPTTGAHWKTSMRQRAISASFRNCFAPCLELREAQSIKHGGCSLSRRQFS